MKAAPGNGYIFENWTENGAVVSRSTSYTFVLTGSRSLVAHFVPNPFPAVSGTYTGLFLDETNGVSPQSAGSITVSATAGGAFSGSLQVGGSRCTLTGQFDSTGRAAKTVARQKANSLMVGLQIDLSSGTDQITGHVTDGTWTAKVVANRVVFNGTTAVPPQAGTYTVVLPGDYTSATETGGCSYGTLAVSKAGAVSCQLFLADGTKITPLSSVSKYGRWPLFSSLNGGQGVLWGWLTFTNASDLGGVIAWIKPASTARYYPAGFSLAVHALGARYFPPGMGTNVLRLTSSTNLTLTLVGGGLADGITNGIALAANGKVTTMSGPKLNLTFTPSSGAFNGSAVNPAMAKPISFGGVVLQGGGIGCGFFLGTSASGEVRLEP